MQMTFLTALVAEASRKSGLLWVTVGDRRARPVWHVWHEGGAYIVLGGVEQDLPGLETVRTVTVTVRSKDKGGRLLSWIAKPRRVAPDGQEWSAVVALLHAQRLNPADGEEQPNRWRRDSQVYRLEPTGIVTERPGAMPDTSQAAPPPPSPAITRGRLPFVLGRATGRVRPRPDRDGAGGPANPT